eukprot:TRINITY_DN21661_c0_g1_i1.p1 TRINITY_DN21661_c0_g1~~TRINITY_DN21661_c0_g1_i1.p1  ORF type:complete len:227 (-),score=67.96 TRINITY_DN21661_c0_g1_i1:222-902(-)
MEELEDLDDEMEGLISEIRKGIDGLKKEADKATRVAYLQGRITRAKQTLRNMRVELREVKKAEGDVFKRKADRHNETLTQLIQDLSWAEQNATAKDPEAQAAARTDVDNMTADQVLAKAERIQQGDLARIENFNNVLVQDQQIGEETLAALQAQTEQLQEIEKGVDEIQSNLVQARKQLRAFVRRMATDKIIMVFMCLVVLAIIAVIIVHYVAPGSVSKVKDQFNP